LLARLWLIKEAAWREADGTFAVLKDQRKNASGNHRTPEIPQKDLDLVIGHAVRLGGRVSQAWRYVIETSCLASRFGLITRAFFSPLNPMCPASFGMP
jgi:hypothetical protein